MSHFLKCHIGKRQVACQIGQRSKQIMFMINQMEVTKIEGDEDGTVEELPEDDSFNEDSSFDDNDDAEEYDDEDAEEELFRENPLKALWIRTGEIKEMLENGN